MLAVISLSASSLTRSSLSSSRLSSYTMLPSFSSNFSCRTLFSIYILACESYSPSSCKCISPLGNLPKER